MHTRAQSLVLHIGQRLLTPGSSFLEFSRGIGRISLVLTPVTPCYEARHHVQCIARVFVRVAFAIIMVSSVRAQRFVHVRKGIFSSIGSKPQQPIPQSHNDNEHPSSLPFIPLGLSFPHVVLQPLLDSPANSPKT